jgi:hypothetical protein
MSWVIFARSLAFLQDRWQGTPVTNQRPPAAYAKGKRSRGARVPRCYQKHWKSAVRHERPVSSLNLSIRCWTRQRTLYCLQRKRPYLLTRHGRSGIPLRLRKKGPSHASTALYLISARYCTNIYSQPFLFLIITATHGFKWLWF